MAEASDSADEARIEMKKRFYEELPKNRIGVKSNHVHIDADKYANLINEVTNARIAEKKNERQYRLLKRYDVQVIDSEKYLISPLKRQDQEVQYFASDDRLFEIMWNAHFRIGHGGRDRMEKELGRTYSNVTRKDIVMFLQLCIPCQRNQKSQHKGVVVKPILANDFNERCQVDLIDYQSQQDGEFKYLLVYQDHLTKFVILEPLQTKTAVEVASKIMEIFAMFGAPLILQSDNGKEFSNSIINKLTDLWSGLKIVHGKPRHSQSQGSVERANRDIEHMISTWMSDNKTTRWSYGAKFVQLCKNRAFHSGIKMSPFEAVFGRKIKVGLTLGDGMSHQFKNIETEAQLRTLLELDSPTGQDQKKTNMCVTMFSSKKNREEARKNLGIQASKMINKSKKRYPDVDVGATVRVSIPLVDRGRGDPTHILAVVLEREEDAYTLGTSNGRKYSSCPVSSRSPSSKPGRVHQHRLLHSTSYEYSPHPILKSHHITPAPPKHHPQDAHTM
ncbi:hypothetical protein DMENIID0001_042850 [Sergentomyia squamirostris]